MNLKKLILPVLIVVTVIGIFTAGFYANTLYQKQQEAAAKKVGTAFVTNIANSKSDAAYSELMKDVQSAHSKEEFSKAWSAFAANSVNLAEPTSVYKNGTVFYSQTIKDTKQTYSGKNEVTIAVILKRAGTKWVVASASVL